MTSPPGLNVSASALYGSLSRVGGRAVASTLESIFKEDTLMSSSSFPGSSSDGSFLGGNSISSSMKGDVNGLEKGNGTMESLKNGVTTAVSKMILNSGNIGESGESNNLTVPGMQSLRTLKPLETFSNYSGSVTSPLVTSAFNLLEKVSSTTTTTSYPSRVDGADANGLGQIGVNGVRNLWQVSTKLLVTANPDSSPPSTPGDVPYSRHSSLGIGSTDSSSTIASPPPTNPPSASLDSNSLAFLDQESDNNLLELLSSSASSPSPSSITYLSKSFKKAVGNVSMSTSYGNSAPVFLYDQDEPLSLPISSSLMMQQSGNDSLYGGVNDTSWLNMTDFFGNGTATEELQSFNYWALLFIIFPLFTVFGNVLVILSVKRERSLHNVTNYFIVSLAVADLLVAALAMPFAVYFLFLDFQWVLPPIFCDIYIAMDVVCSTSSICNLVAISIDRFIAVTQPIKYAKHKSNTRVWLTIVFVWVFSALVGSPIVLGLNAPSDGTVSNESECLFHNKVFVFFSSLCSFYIPCAILVCLYYRIFKVIRERANKSMHGGGGGRKPGGNSKGGTVIENLAQTKRLAETALGGPSSLPTPKLSNVDDEKLTNTGSGSQDDADDKDDVDGELDGEDNSPDSDDCHIIPNNQASSVFVLEAVKDGDRCLGGRGNEPNGNHDSGYAASNLEDIGGMGQEPSPVSPKLSLVPPESGKRNGLLTTVAKEEEEDEGVVEKVARNRGVSSGVILSSPVEGASGSGKKGASRFTICKVHKASRKKREKSSAKRERKATKTLAIVLGLFLICWLPFFTCNIMDALCTILKKDCSPGLAVFVTTTWLGYVNSCLNPVIYTIFNPEFRKAFKKIMGFTT